MAASGKKLVWWDTDLLLRARERRLLPVPLHAYSKSELLEELARRSAKRHRVWLCSDRDVMQTAVCYQLPLYMASIPTWYVEHPLFVVRKHMDRNSLRFLEAARRIFQEAGYYGFFAGYSTYGARALCLERRLPSYSEVRERFWFSCGGLRLPIAFGLSHVGIHFFSTLESSALVPLLCCFGSGFLASLCSCPKETLMRDSIFSHADYVKNCTERRRFAEQPVLQRVFECVKNLSLDPVGQKHYSPTSALAAKANIKGLLHLWPIHCCGEGIFFAGFCCTYQRCTGHLPVDWIKHSWQDAIVSGSLAVLIGSLAALPVDLAKISMDRNNLQNLKELGRHIAQHRSHSYCHDLTPSMFVLLCQRVSSHCVQFFTFAALATFAFRLPLPSHESHLWMLRVDAFDEI